MLNSYLLTVWDDDLLYVQLPVCIICYIYIYIYIYMIRSVLSDSL